MIKQPSILIVDDNADSRLAVIAALRKKEYLFYEAKDGEEGVALARKHLPSVIIMDINMPKLNGYEALELLKADSNTEAIPVIIVTAIGSMDEKIVALEKGADGLWSKPFDRKILLEQIESLIKLKKLQNESLVALENTLLHRQSQELIRYYYTDSLTSLPNRSQLIKNLEQQTRCGLILIDIDSFKDIVYFYGHAIGDAFLKPL
ncbi:MAG: response regulator [Thiovulaceae bacterium]|nr:response regulator [Sulfurimonadaceae bacterium]